jgi:hypothetical protein
LSDCSSPDSEPIYIIVGKLTIQIQNLEDEKMKTFALFGVLVMVIGSLAGLAQALGPLDGLDAKGDNDRDGLSNAQEYVWGTDPNDPSSAGTGIYDGWLVWYETHRALDAKGNTYVDANYHFDPNDPSIAGTVPNVDKEQLIQVADQDANPAVNDPDSDGWNNLREFLVGTDPTNPNTDGDMYVEDSSDPDPLIATQPPCNDDHGNGGPGSGHNGVAGNGGGGSGIGQVMNIL